MDLLVVSLGLAPPISPPLPAIVLQTTRQKHPALFFPRVVGIVLEFREWFQSEAAATAAAVGEESDASGELQPLLDVISC